MNVGAATGLPASFAGIPFAQATETDQTRTEAAAQRRATAAEIHAEKAAGIGETDGQDHSVDDRDADGRRPWELGPAPKEGEPEANFDADAARQSRDASGESGGQLDLTG